MAEVKNKQDTIKVTKNLTSGNYTCQSDNYINFERLEIILLGTGAQRITFPDGRSYLKGPDTAYVKDNTAYLSYDYNKL